MNESKKLILSVLATLGTTLGFLTVLYFMYGRYVQMQCNSRIDEMMTKNVALDLNGQDTGLTVQLATPSMSLTPEVTPSATPTKKLIKLPPTLTPPPAQ